MVERPDLWTLVEIEEPNTDEIFYKVLATFHGGYLYGDAWRLNSGIKSVDLDDKFWIIHGFSGSRYDCNFEQYGMNNLTYNIAVQLEERGARILNKTEAHAILSKMLWAA